MHHFVAVDEATDVARWMHGKLSEAEPDDSGVKFCGAVRRSENQLTGSSMTLPLRCSRLRIYFGAALEKILSEDSFRGSRGEK